VKKSRGKLWWHYAHTKVHENPFIGSKVIKTNGNGNMMMIQPYLFLWIRK